MNSDPTTYPTLPKTLSPEEALIQPGTYCTVCIWSMALYMQQPLNLGYDHQYTNWKKMQGNGAERQWQSFGEKQRERQSVRDVKYVLRVKQEQRCRVNEDKAMQTFVLKWRAILENKFVLIRFLSQVNSQVVVSVTYR